MPDLFSKEIVSLIVGFIVLTILIRVAIYVLGKLRVRPLQQERTANEQLDYFRELESQGKLSSEEYRKVKQRLSAQIVEQGKKSDRNVSEEPAVLWARQHDLGSVDGNEETRVVGLEMENGDDTVVVERLLDGERL